MIVYMQFPKSCLAEDNHNKVHVIMKRCKNPFTKCTLNSCTLSKKRDKKRLKLPDPDRLSINSSETNSLYY